MIYWLIEKSAVRDNAADKLWQRNPYKTRQDIYVYFNFQKHNIDLLVVRNTIFFIKNLGKTRSNLLLKKDIASTAQRWQLFTARTLKKRVRGQNTELIKKSLDHVPCFSKQTLHVKSGRVDFMVTTYLWVGKWLSGWVAVWLAGWMDGWMDGWMTEYLYLSVKVK